MALVRTLLLLAALCAPGSALCLHAPDSEPDLLCDGELLPRASSEARAASSALSHALSLLYRPAEPLSSQESREKRTLPGSNYKYLSQTLLRSKMYRNSAKTDRRNKVTLSLDVPTNIMNILFDIAKAKNLRAKAAHNARLMAQIGK